MDFVTTNDWSSYLSAQASAAASLTGLVFVAVSINLTRVISVPGLAGRAAESIIQLFGVFIVSSAAASAWVSAPWVVESRNTRSPS